ncbi:MarR family winged helix-turn-helix transcriptional regulator [Shimazuella kribbensis]|uniref:MarR family winged helix-turn-helix transcriptional regulator n=1 Tax=Shimazuella kribbensis TaxID=139808 RepID=UPI0003FEEF95|nr:MarR family transcriptional regulator [Shimazuella kribbensis]
MTDDEVLEFVSAMRLCVKRSFHILHEHFKKYNLTIPQGQVLRVLNQKGSLSLVEISKELDSKPSSMSGLIDRLVKAEMVTRERDKDDRRVVWIALSDKSKQLFANFPYTQAQYYRTYLEKLSDEEFSQLSVNLKKLVRILEEG